MPLPPIACPANVPNETLTGFINKIVDDIDRHIEKTPLVNKRIQFYPDWTYNGVKILPEQVDSALDVIYTNSGWKKFIIWVDRNGKHRIELIAP